MAPSDSHSRPGGEDDAVLHEEAGRILLDAEELAGEERARYLREACADRPGLLELVQSLDRDLEAARGFMDGAPGGALRRTLERRLEEGSSVEPDLPAEPGTMLGSYRLVRRLAQGGMGTVYEAEQSSPRRRVAVKVIAPGMATPEVLRRFRLEGEVLARLSHPGIAKVLEVSEPEAPAPWFAMELVDGLTLTEHARAKELGIPERLALLAATCDAVAHAHSRGVVHRDLKPSNVLVDREGHPRVLDFGVARATGLDAQSSALLTRTGDLVGTLAYMSPEQAWGRKDEIDARTDVYALGVLGFELLTGQLPRRLEELSFGEALHVLRDGEVDRAESIDPRLAGDVSTILAKALESEPAQRYESAAALAADLRRCLRDEPIVARAPSAGYRAAKFLRRHRRLAAVTAAAFVALAAVASVAVRSAVEASRASRVAERQAYRANLAAAAGALELGNVATARRRLHEAPERLRGWEWEVLLARTGGTTASVPLEGARGLALDETGERAFVLAVEPGDDPDARLVELGLPGLETLASRPLALDGVIEVPEGLLAHVAAWLLSRSDEGPWTLSSGGRRLELARPPGSRPGRGSVSPHVVLAVLPLTDGTGRGLFELATGRRLADPPSWPGRFGPDDRSWVTAGVTQVDLVRLDDPDRSLVLETPPVEDEGDARADDDGFLNAAMSVDGRSVYTSSYGSAAYLRRWDAFTGEPLRTTSARARTTWNADDWGVAADGSLVAWAPGEGSVHLYDARLRRRLGIVHAEKPQSLGQVAIGPGARRLAALGSGAVHSWELGAAFVPDVLRAHDSYVYSVAHEPSGRRFVTAGWDNRLRTWDAESLRLLTSLDLPWPLSANERLIEATFTPSGELACVTNTGLLVVLDPWTGSSDGQTRGLDGWATSQLAVDPRGEWVAVSDPNRRLPTAVLRLDDRTPVPGMTGLSGSATWSPDGSRLAALREEGIVLLDREGAVRGSLPMPPEAGEPRLRWGPRADRMVAATNGAGVLLYDPVARRLLHRLQAPEGGQVHDAVVSPDGRRVASGHGDGAVRIWDAETGDLLATWAGHGLYVRSLSFSPDGEVLLSASGDRTVRRWDARSSRERNRILAERERLAVRGDAIVAGRRAEGLAGAALVAALREDANLSEDERTAALAAVTQPGPGTPAGENAR